MQKDYILRLIEQAGFVLRQLLQRIQAEPVTLEERTHELQRAAQLGGLDLDMLRLSDLEGLWHQVALTGEADPARTWLAAETLYADALAIEIEGNEEAALETYLKAASLFRLMEPTWVLPTGFPEATERVEEVEKELEVHRAIYVGMAKELGLSEQQFLPLVDQAFKMGPAVAMMSRGDVPDEIKGQVEAAIAMMMKGDASEH